MSYFGLSRNPEYFEDNPNGLIFIAVPLMGLLILANIFLSRNWPGLGLIGFFVLVALFFGLALSTNFLPSSFQKKYCLLAAVSGGAGMSPFLSATPFTGRFLVYEEGVEIRCSLRSGGRFFIPYERMKPPAGFAEFDTELIIETDIEDLPSQFIFRSLDLEPVARVMIEQYRRRVTAS